LLLRHCQPTSLPTIVQQDIRELQRRTDRFLVGSFTTVVAVGGLVVSLVKFWNP
jgi:hypothetical protein